MNWQKCSLVTIGIFIESSLALSQLLIPTSPFENSIDQVAKLSTNQKNYYVERRSYGTGRETEPPRYVKFVDKSWLHDYTDIDWLDLGLDYRVRYEYRDNDFRRSHDTFDDPILLRTRLFFGIKNLFDPLRATLEMGDARRNHSQFPRKYDTRDVNFTEPVQAYVELYFKETLLGRDDLGNARPISIRAGRHAFEYTDRRLLARNEWRNSTNSFQGIRGIIGQQFNDWQVDLLALKPLQRITYKLDEVDYSQDFFGVIFDLRRWSGVGTIQPYYYLLKQDGGRVKYDSNGAAAVNTAKIDREIHTGGMRVYGVIGDLGWDYDANYAQQWGRQQRLADDQVYDLTHNAYAYNAEVGYSPSHPWKPRFSLFYGFASGDRNLTDGKNQRFERLFGFARPWSNNDYFQMENLVAPKIRLEFEPPFSLIPGLKVDTGYSWYQLDSATDRWSGANLRDDSGKSGKDIGQEVDARMRFPMHKYLDTNLGYAKFWAGSFAKKTSRNVDPDRRPHSDFIYVELTAKAL